MTKSNEPPTSCKLHGCSRLVSRDGLCRPHYLKRILKKGARRFAVESLPIGKLSDKQLKTLSDLPLETTKEVAESSLSLSDPDGYQFCRPQRNPTEIHQGRSIEARIARHIKTTEAMKKLRNEAIVAALQATHENGSIQ